MKLSRAVFYGLFFLAAGCSPTKRVTVGGTDLCFPKQYSPGFDLTIWLMTHVGQDIPTGDEALIYIPAREIQNAIPNYVVSHSNQYTPAVMHDLNGLVMGPSMTRADLAQDAWRVRASATKYFLEQDKRTGYTRVYTQTDRPSFMWDLVRSPPPASPDGPPPKDWYIGHCLELVGSYDCKQLVRAGNVRLEFDINETNLALRDGINGYAKEQLQSWISRCKG